MPKLLNRKRGRKLRGVEFKRPLLNAYHAEARYWGHKQSPASGEFGRNVSRG